MQTIFLTGASGFIGGSVAVQLINAGYAVRGLVRDRAKAVLVAQAGMVPVLGDLDDTELLSREAGEADGVFSAADSDHVASLKALLAGLAGSGKPLIHISGSSVIADDARGTTASATIFDEDTPLIIHPFKQPRRDIDLMVLDGSASAVRSVVICPSMIYGTGYGLNKESIQIPFLVQVAKAEGKVVVVGEGVNRWSHVHIDDLCTLILLALQSAPPGSFYFAEHGEASYEAIGTAISTRLGLDTVGSIPAHVAAEKWGAARAYFSFGGNSRVHAKRARAELGWRPAHGSLISWIELDMPV